MAKKDQKTKSGLTPDQLRYLFASGILRSVNRGGKRDVFYNKAAGKGVSAGLSKAYSLAADRIRSGIQGAKLGQSVGFGTEGKRDFSATKANRLMKARDVLNSLRQRANSQNIRNEKYILKILQEKKGKDELTPQVQKRMARRVGTLEKTLSLQAAADRLAARGIKLDKTVPNYRRVTNQERVRFYKQTGRNPASKSVRKNNALENVKKALKAVYADNSKLTEEQKRRRYAILKKRERKIENF